MRNHRLAVLAGLLCVFANSGHCEQPSTDAIVIHFVRGRSNPDSARTQTIDRTITGGELVKIESALNTLLASMSDQTKWWDVGPDAAYVAADIHYRGKEYGVYSWYPLYRGHPKIAVSERRGLVFVSSPAKKNAVELENSQRYRTLVAFWDAVLPPTNASKSPTELSQP
jgi:hypothetical protein